MTLNTAVNNPQLVPLPSLRPCRSCALPTRAVASALEARPLRQHPP